MNPHTVRRAFHPSRLRADGADFLAAVFPEQAFPAAADTASDYGLACRRGYAAMAETRVAITGLARNLGAVLPLTIRRIEDLGRWFADYRVVVFENDSTDGTRLELKRWAVANRRVEVVCEDRHDPVNPTTRCLARAERMATYRRRCQEQVLGSCSRFDHTLIIDLDILGGWSVDGIANSFGHPGWDFMGSNGLVYRRRGLTMNEPRQYDTWALRFDDALTPLSTVVAGGMVYSRGEPPVRVTSCFGGLGIYTMDAYRAGRYSTDDLEHATFHREMIAAGFGQLFLNPSQLVIYGRRHRFGDRAIGLLLDGWAAASGRRQQTLFPRGCLPVAPAPVAALRAAA